MLVDRGLVRRNGHGWKLDPSVELPLPETVHGIIAARLDALRREEKALLQDAAVLGQTFWVGALAAVGAVPRESVEERLRMLERKEFSRRERRSSLTSELQYEFRHVLVRDVAYAQIPRALRAEKHRRAAEWLESIAQDRTHHQAEMLAYHYLTALELAREAGQTTEELELRARQAAQDAGDHATAIAAYASAARFYETALRLAPPDDPLRPELLLRLGRASVHARQAGEAELAEARKLLLERGDLDLAAEADVLLATLLTSQGRRAQGREHLERAARVVESSGSLAARAHVLTQLARMRLLAGAADEALAAGRDAVEVAGRAGRHDLRAHALVNVGAARVATGDLEGTKNVEAAIMLAHEVNSPESVRATRMLASQHQLLGKLSRAAELYASAREQAGRFGDAFEKRWLNAAYAMELHWNGRWAEALEVADAFIARTADGMPHYMESVCRRVRGEIRAADGDLDAALSDAEAAVEFGRHARDAWFFYPSLTFRARVLHAQGRVDEAAAAIDDLLAVDERQQRILLMSFRTAVDLAVVMAELGRSDDLLLRLERFATPTRWVAAAASYATGDLDAAADAYSAMGALADAAETRLQAARKLAGEARRDEAEARAAEAAAFFEQAGGTALLEEARRLVSGAHA
jgi:predicted ATPase